MQGVYQHKPMSQILAPVAESEEVAALTAAQAQAKAPAAENQNDLPEKYQGKTSQEIAEMHMNSEKRLGQIQNEVGQLRGLVSDLAQVQRSPTPATPEPEPVDVSGDDLMQRPGEAIRKVVQPLIDAAKPQETPAPTTDPLYAMEQNALISDFGDPGAIANSQDFQDFVARTGTRQADFQRACDTELGVEQVRAARRLLEDFQDFQTVKTPTTAQTVKTNVEQAKAAATESSGPAGAISTGEVIYAADVVNLINTNPEKYRSPSFQKALNTAIREGRYVK